MCASNKHKRSKNRECQGIRLSGPINIITLGKENKDIETEKRRHLGWAASERLAYILKNKKTSQRLRSKVCTSCHYIWCPNIDNNKTNDNKDDRNRTCHEKINDRHFNKG